MNSGVPWGWGTWGTSLHPAEKLPVFPRARAKKSIVKAFRIKNQRGSPGIFALVPPPDFGHGTPLMNTCPELALYAMLAVYMRFGY